MYQKLRSEIFQREKTIASVARDTGIRVTTLYDKMKGRTDFKMGEARAIKKAIGTDLSIEELFER
jgi:DNA-binding phage protein